MPNRLRSIPALLAAALVCGFAGHAQTGRPVSGVYDGVLHLATAADGSISGYFYETTGNQFSCGFVLFSNGKPGPGGTYKVVGWWPLRTLGEPIDDERAVGSLKVDETVVTLQLTKGAFGGCWNVDPELNAGKPVDYQLDKDGRRPQWKEFRVVKSKRVALRPTPDAPAPSKPYLVASNVVAVTETRGDWLHVEYTSGASGKVFSGWVQQSDLLPAGVPQ